MDKQLFQIPGYMSGFKTMSKGVRIHVDTQEELPEELAGRLYSFIDKFGYFTFLVGEQQIAPEDVLGLPEYKPIEKTDKSPSQRLRAVFAVMWKQDPQNFKTADDHYRFMMEKLIEFYKSKLED